MEPQQKIEELKYVIDRYDHYYDSINNKGNLYLTINTFVLAGIIVGFYTLNIEWHFNKFVFVLFYAALAGNLASILFTLRAIKPFIKEGHKEAKSRIYFYDVASYSRVQWEKKWEQLSQSDHVEDLQLQAFELAKGLKIKFRLLSNATWSIGLQALSCIIFGVQLLLTEQK